MEYNKKQCSHPPFLILPVLRPRVPPTAAPKGAVLRVLGVKLTGLFVNFLFIISVCVSFLDILPFADQ